MKLLHVTQHFFWSYSAGDFLKAVEHTSATQRILVVLCGGILAGFARWLMEKEPGGHAGEIAEALWFHSGRMPLLRAATRSMLSVIIVGLGASLGREAAPKMAGGAIANLLADYASVPSLERKLLVACGAGAGMGAVYNVPLGGAFFALETLLGTLALPLIAPAVISSVLATIISWSMLPDRPTYVVPEYEMTATQLVWCVVFAPITGFVAAFYVRAISWSDSCKASGWQLFVWPILVFAGLGFLAIPFPQLLGNGKDTVQHAFVGQLDLLLLVALIFLKPLATCACLGSGAPGGLFTPTLTCGALLGGLLGYLWNLIWPGADLGSYAVIGGAAFLAAALQSPIASIILVFELAPGSASLTIPLMLAVGIAAFVVRLIESKSIYSGRIHSGRAVLSLDDTVAHTSFDKLIDKRCELISSSANYAEILEKQFAIGDGTEPLYVVAEKGQFVGVISRPVATDPSQLERAIGMASDVAEPHKTLDPTIDKAQVIKRLNFPSAPREMPVVDTKTRRLLGVIKRDRILDACRLK